MLSVFPPSSVNVSLVPSLTGDIDVWAVLTGLDLRDRVFAPSHVKEPASG
jgi:hypothetical protein